MELEKLNIIISASTQPLKDGLNDVRNQLNKLEKTTNKSADKMGKGFFSFKNILKGLGIGLIFKTIANSMGDAISRLDTLNNYTKVMSNLGISGQDAEIAMLALDKSIQGLPTKLDDATLAVQRLTAVNGNVKASTSMFVGLNNALLAGGTSAESVKNAMEQVMQAYSKGKPDMMEWRAMIQAMPAQLNQIATAMGYASSTELGVALRQGDVSMNKFLATITQLNKQGINGFQSFEEQAKNSTNGVATSVINLKTAFSRGIANIMNEIGQSNIAGFFRGITNAVNVCMAYVSAFVRVIMTAISFIGGLFGKNTQKNAKSTAKNVGGVSTALGDIGDSASSAGNGMDKASGKAKKLKKELNGLASFDEMNVLKENDNSDSDSGGSAGGGGAGGVGDLSGVDMSMFDDLTKGASAVDKAYANIMSIIQKVVDAIKKIDFSGIITHATNIGKTLKDIFTDPELLNTGKTFVDHFISSLGNLAVSIIQVGVNITEWLLGSIDNYLSQNKERIKNHLVSMFSIQTERLDIFDKAVEVVTTLSSIFTNPTAKQIGADIIAMFTNPIMSALELLSKFSRDVENLFVTPIHDNLQQLKSTFEGMLEPIQTVTGTLSEAWTYIGDLFNKVYDQHFKPFFDSLTKGLSDTFGKFLTVYNTHIAPFVDKASKRFRELWDSHLKPLWDNIGDLIGSVVDYIKLVWEKSLKPFIDWVIQNIVPIIVPILDTIGSVVSTVFSIIVDIVSGIIKTISGLLKFVTGVFSGDWKKAWEGIKQAFSAPFNTMKSIASSIMTHIKTTVSNAVTTIKNTVNAMFNTIKTKFSTLGSTIGNAISKGVKGAINGVLSLIEGRVNSAIGIINGAIRLINKLPGVNVGQLSTVKLPRLARGGIVDKPTIAQVGENGREAIMPLERNTNWITDLANKLDERQGGSKGQPIQLVVKIGEDTLLDKVIDGIQDKNFETNGGAFRYDL